MTTRPLAAGLLPLAAAAALAGCPRPQQVRPAWLELADEATLRAAAATDPRAARDLGLHELLVADLPEDAERTLREATRRAPADPLGWIALAALSEAHGEQDEAVESLARAIAAASSAELDPGFCAPAGIGPAPDERLCRETAAAIEEGAARTIQRIGSDRAAAVAGELLRRAGPGLGLASAHLLGRTLEAAARRSGDGAAAARVLREEAGCVLDWRAAGPFGPHPAQSFDLEHPPEVDGTLRQAYDLGPGPGEQPTRVPVLSACEVQLVEPLARAGTWYAEAAVRPSEAGQLEVRLWAPASDSVVVWVGGAEVLRRDGRAGYGPAVSLARAEVDAEPTRIRVKLTSSSYQPAFSLALREVRSGAPPGPVASSSGPWPGSGRSVDVPDLLEALGPRAGQPVPPPRALLAHLLARSRMHWTLAEEALHRLRAPAAIALLHRAEASSRSPAASRGVRADRELSDMRAALARDGRLVQARVVVAARLAADSQVDEALELVREGLEVQPRSAALWHEAGALARRLGLHGQAEEAFGRAHELDPRSCESLRQLALMFDEAGLFGRREAELERLAACDATSRTPADLLARTGRLDEALAALRRLEAASEHPAALQGDIAELELRAGRPEAARAILEREAARWPRSASHQLTLADLAGLARGPEAAARRLVAATRRHRWEMSGLARPAGALGAERELEAFRVDGLEQIARYRRSGLSYAAADAPSAYVLDRAVYRVHPDLSTLRLVHQVVHVLTQEAIGPLSEFEAPQDGEVLTLRTIKADGRVLEPLAFDEDGTTNLVGVEVGDFVEWEYVTWGGPSRVYPGGLVTPRFYFASTDTAMHLSELVVLAPEGVEVDYVPRGPSPPRGEPVRLGGLRGMRFAARRVPSQVREARMPSPSEVFPSVAAVIGESPEAAVSAWADGTASAMRSDFRMRELVRALRRRGQTEVELARAIYGHVVDHVQGGAPSASASETLAAGRGNALVLLAALLGTAGFRAELVDAWPLQADRSGRYMVPTELVGGLVRVVLDGEEHFLSYASRFSPFGHLPAAFRGQPALVRRAAPERITLPDASPVPDSVETVVEGEVRADGGLGLELEERHLGERAAELRAALSRVAAAERGRHGAAILGSEYPGAMTDSVAFEGLDDRDATLIVRARLGSAMIGRREGGSLLVPARLGSSVRYSRLASLSERRTTLVFDTELREVVVQRLRLPAGARVVRPCAGGRVDSELGTFTVACELDAEGALVHRLELAVPPQRVPAASYPAFAALLRGYDEAGATESLIALP